jgi:hypothetical protein
VSPNRRRPSLLAALRQQRRRALRGEQRRPFPLAPSRSPFLCLAWYYNGLIQIIIARSLSRSRQRARPASRDRSVRVARERSCSRLSTGTVSARSLEHHARPLSVGCRAIRTHGGFAVTGEGRASFPTCALPANPSDQQRDNYNEIAIVARQGRTARARTSICLTHSDGLVRSHRRAASALGAGLAEADALDVTDRRCPTAGRPTAVARFHSYSAVTPTARWWV